jgi:hypothetical protein
VLGTGTWITPCAAIMASADRVTGRPAIGVNRAWTMVSTILPSSITT